MLRIYLTNYPVGATSSSMEIVPEAEMPGPVDNYWVSYAPVTEPHVFDIPGQFCPLLVTLFVMTAGSLLVYRFQGSNPDGADYQYVVFDTNKGDWTFDVGNEQWSPHTNWAPWIIASAIMVATAYFAIEGIQKSKR